MLLAWHPREKRQDRRHAPDEFLGAERLVLVACLAPALTGQVTFDALLKNLRKCDLGAFGLSVPGLLYSINVHPEAGYYRHVIVEPTFDVYINSCT